MALLCGLNSSICLLPAEGTKVVSSCAEGKREQEEGRNILTLEEKESPFQQSPEGTLWLLLVLFGAVGAEETWQMIFQVEGQWQLLSQFSGKI